MYCSNCGKDINDDSKWCSYCGKKVNSNNNVNNKNDNSNSKSKPLFTASHSVWLYGKKIGISLLIFIISLLLGVVSYLYAPLGIKWYLVGFFGLGVLIGLFIIIGYNIVAHASKIIFYPNYIVVREGIFNTKERHSALTKIIGVRIDQSFWGKICNYGDIYLDKIGEWDIDLDYIRQPNKLKKYIERFIQNEDYTTVKQVIDD